MAISFYQEDTGFKLPDRNHIKHWVKSAIESENRLPGMISIILCSDYYLLGLNQKYLNHDYFTDIVTFDYSDGGTLSGDLFISIDRVKDNAVKNSVDTQQELHRVIIHGILHLSGYDDKSPEAKNEMSLKEDLYLSQY